MEKTQDAGPAVSTIEEIRQDPSLMLALATGTVLTAFLLTVHACCIGLATPDHLAALLQICSPRG
ncbi:hypothetical protein [Roseibium sp. MMSF_3544]|uniref:hypothetical protein n=1 Tax=unclassified Roseibium TaxID=2629323 RepID=UPI00273E9EFB|nr:hypothetical protein [Roseibium sp. MMSF_3544]